MAHTAVLDVDALPTRDGPTSLDAAHALAVAPTLPARWLPRPRPLRALHAATGRRIVLVRGPAGYGKSALVAHWARSTGRPIAWVCFDRSDDHPDHVASLVAAAIRRVAPGATLDTRGHSDTDAVAGLCDAIERAGVHALVLDDVDVLSDAAALDVVRRLTSSMPACARTIASARGALSQLPIARWRWRGDLADLEADTLAFTRDETARYLRDAWGWPADAATVERVWTRTGGWPAALHVIASRSPRTGGDVLDVDADRLDEFTAAVLGREDPGDVAWLMRCSVLDVLDPDACADLVGDGAVERLGRLASRGLVTPGDDGGHRLPPLLRDALRQRLRTRVPIESEDLWRRALRARAERGDPVGAVTTAHRGGDHALALAVLDAHRGAIAAADGGATLRRLASRLDDEAVAARPALVSTLVDLAAVSRDLSQLHELCDALPQPHDEAAAAAAIHAEATLARLTGTGRPGVCAGSADDDLATLDHLRGVEAGWDGHHARAEKLLRSALAAASRRGDAIGRLVVLGDLVWEYARAGRAPVAELLARRARALSRRLRLDQPPVIVELAGVSIAIDRGQRDRADRRLRRLEHAVDTTADPLLAFELATMRLRIDHAPDAIARALRTLAGITTAARGRYGGELARRLSRADATLRLQTGDPGGEAAAARVLTADRHRELRPADRLLLARLLLRRGQPARAQTIAAGLVPEANGPRLAVAARTLEAAAARAGGDRRAALAALRRARETALAQSITPGGAVAVPAIRPLERLPVSGGLRGTVRTRRAAPVSLGTDDRPPAAEPLTERELEVLRLLPSGLRYKDIATELAVSLNTVKSHLKSVYRKLGARSRYEALDRADQLDLITTEHSTGAAAGAQRSPQVADVPQAFGPHRSVASHSVASPMPDGAKHVQQLGRPPLADHDVGVVDHLVVARQHRDRGVRTERPGEPAPLDDVG